MEAMVGGMTRMEADPSSMPEIHRGITMMRGAVIGLERAINELEELVTRATYRVAL